MPLPCVSTFTFPVLGILLKQTMSRRLQDVWLSSLGRSVLSSLTPQPICPVTFHCPPPATPTHGREGRTWDDSARMHPSPLTFSSPGMILRTQAEPPSHGYPSINRHLQLREPGLLWALKHGEGTMQRWTGGRFICRSHYSDESDQCLPGSPRVSRDTVKRAMCEMSSGSGWGCCFPSQKSL